MAKFSILITGEGNVGNKLPQDADAMAHTFANDLAACGHTIFSVEVEKESPAPVPAPAPTPEE